METCEAYQWWQMCWRIEKEPLFHAFHAAVCFKCLATCLSWCMTHHDSVLRIVCMAGSWTGQSSRNLIAQSAIWISGAVRDSRVRESFVQHKYILSTLGGQLLVLHVVHVCILIVDGLPPWSPSPAVGLSGLQIVLEEFHEAKLA